MLARALSPVQVTSPLVRIHTIPGFLFGLLDHFRARPVRDTPRGSCAPLMAGDCRPPGGRQYHDACLISRVGLGRFGLLGEEVGVFLERSLAEDRRLPELGREVAVRGRDRVEDRRDEVARRARVAARRGVAVLEARHTAWGREFGMHA